jgi:hypothetical protein
METVTEEIPPEEKEAKKLLLSAEAIVGRPPTFRLWRAFFGAHPATIGYLWMLLFAANEWTPWEFCVNHLLWTLFFLKTYNIELVTCAILQCDPKTLRTWVWRVLAVLFETLHSVHS